MHGTRNLWRQGQCWIKGGVGDQEQRDGPVPWPPRSPDIPPLDFFLWGYVEGNAYRTKIRDITDLKQKITDAIATADEAMLRATNGAHIEVY